MKNRQNRRARAISQEMSHTGPEPEAVEDLDGDQSDADLFDDFFFFPGSYRGSLESRGLEVVAETAFGYYQGDLVFVVRGPDDRHGTVVVGFGSCSGCDALQACSSQDEVDALVDAVIRNIRWGGKEELRAYLMGESAINWWATESSGIFGEVDDLLRTLP